MAVQNPFTADPVKGEVWEQGFVAGFSEPETDHVLPLAPELLEIYQTGEQVGRDERRRLPPEEGGVGHPEGNEASHLAEVAEELGIHTLGHFFLEMVFKGAGGLIGIVATALQIPGDVQLRPLEPDFTGPIDQPNEHFMALCPRADHSLVLEGVTTDGYWAGPGRDFFSEAVADMKGHGHPEALVARCDLDDGTCGAVWPGTGL
jgi:hypothetical protein